MSPKEKLYQYCFQYVEDRLARIHKNIAGIQQSLSSETKSSAGDKHETGRAMLQLEREKLGQQLWEAEKMKQLLAKVPLKSSKEVIGLGSLVETTAVSYYLSISAGACTIQEEVVYCVSLRTPIGQLLLGKSKGDVFVFNAEQLQILDIS